jgi:hypothetical protein
VNAKHTHLTYTGSNAGRPICGNPREAGGSYLHAALAKLETQEQREPICKACLSTWFAYAYAGEPLPLHFPVTVEEIEDLELEIPQEFASDAEIAEFRAKLKSAIAKATANHAP